MPDAVPNYYQLPDLRFIDNIIFDLGRVIIDINEQASIDAFHALGIEDMEQLYLREKQHPIFEQLETGQVSTPTFLQTIRQFFPDHVTEQQLRSAWDALLIGIPQARKELLQDLSNKHQLFLLSNTNEPHMRTIFAMEGREYGEEPLIPAFKQEYYSYKMGMRKPDPAIFQRILDDHQLDPKETLFIDDGLQHVQAAASLQIHAYHLIDGQDIIGLLY